MLNKTTTLFLGYIISIFGSTKENHSHFNCTSINLEGSCESNYWTWKLVCYGQTHSSFASERFAYHSLLNLLNKHIDLQYNRTWSDAAVVKSLHTVEEVLGISHDKSNFIPNASLSALTKSVIKDFGTSSFYDSYFSRRKFIKIPSLVGNDNINVEDSLFNYTSCVQLKEEVGLLFVLSDTLLHYIDSRVLPTQISLHKTAARIVEQSIFDIISNITNNFDIIEQIFSNCIFPQDKESTILTENSFLWFKVDEPNKFRNLSVVFKKRSSFFKITSELQEDLAKSPGFISVQFMTTEHLVRFSYKNFISVSQLMLLSIKRGDYNFEHLSVPVDLFFQYDIHAKSEHLFEGTAHIPPDYDSLFDKDKLVSVYRLMPFHFPGSGRIFIKFYNLGMNCLKVALSIGVKPDWETMSLYSSMISNKSPIYEVTLANQNKDSINYLGITSGGTIPGTIEYNFEVRYFQCYSKFGIEWKSDGCDVGAETNETIIHCQCNHLSLFGGGVAIAPRQADIKQDVKLLFSAVNENPHTCILVSCIILIYLIVLVWTRHNDRKDRLQRFVVVLDDNFPGEEWPYLLTVYTSFWIGAGTEAIVGVRLYGKKGMSRIHILNQLSQRKVLKSNCDDWFLIFTPKNLGEIEKIHIFTNFSGFSPEWYCKKIMLYDLEGQREFKFVIEKWISLSEEDECVDLFCYPTPTKRNLRRDRIALDNIIFGLQETHLLFSIFTRHPRSSVTRSQRLSVCICILLVHLLTSNIFHESELPDFPQYSSTKRKLVIQMESTLVASPFTFIVIFCFKKSRIITVPKNDIPMTLTSTQAVPLETGLEINQKKNSISKSSDKLNENEKQPNIHSHESSEEESDETDDETEDEEEGEEEEVEEEEEVKEIEEGCLKNCYNQIRALVFQVILSKTIMPVKIAEEDEKSARIRRKWMFSSWFLCELAIFGSAFFVLIYSLKMEPEVCSEWMASSIKYSLTNIFFMAPLKITVFALILAGLYGQLHYIPSYECNTEAAVKRKLIGDKRFLSRLLKIRKHKCYKPISSRKTQEIRLRQKNWRRWRIFTNFCVIVFLFVLLIVAVELSWQGLYYYTWFHNHIMFDPRLARKPIYSPKSYMNYLTKVVIPAYDREIWYNGARIMTQDIWKQETGFMKDYSSRLVGVPRIRQQRVEPDACKVPSIMADKLGLQQCCASITWSNLDKKSYAVSWANPEKLVEDPNSPWVYSNFENSPMVICGHKTGKCYTSGGYSAKLSFDGSVSNSILNKLIKEEWFDGLTRVLYFETVVYNVDSNMLSSVVPMLEKLADGSYFIHVKGSCLRPMSYDFYSTLFTLLMFNIYYSIRIVLLFNRIGLKYLLSGSGILDVFLSLLLYATIISLFCNRSARADYLRNWQLQEENDLQITRDIFLHRSLIQYETALMIVLIPIQLLHNFRFGKRYLNYFKTLSYSLKYAVGFACVIYFFYIFFKLTSAIQVSIPIRCLLNRSYNPITYCTGAHKLPYQIELFTFICWFIANIATFVTCVTIVFGYTWMKEQNKYATDFNMLTFFLVKLNIARNKMANISFRAIRKMTGLSLKRMRAGADTVDVVEEDTYPRNRPLSYTKIMLDDMNVKFDNILEKLRDLEKCV